MLCFNILDFNMCLVVQLSLCLLLQLISQCHATAGSTDEYCAYEKFSPSCEDLQVIVMQTATYGRMYMGKCITDDFGFMGCSSDQLMYLDGECSGNSHCEVDISSKDMMDATTECSQSLSVFLEASYYCQKVLQPKSQHCNSPETVSVKDGSGYISSTVSEDSNCGISEAPWLLEALPGQRINLTLTDFSWGQSHSLLNRCPTMYGHLLDYQSEEFIEICGGTSRVKHLLLSESHQVQVILDHGALQQARFIIKYEAIGCPDKVPPRNGWIRKKEDGVTVGCHTDSQTWSVKCIGNHWLGAIGNCSDTGVAEKTTKEETTSFNSDHVISVAIGSLALVICCVTVTIGVYFVKKHQYKASYVRSGSESYVVPIPYRGATQQPHPTVYTKCQQNTAGQPDNNQQTQPRTHHGNMPDVTDMNNTTRTGFTFQRPAGAPPGATILRPTTAVEVHRVPAHMAPPGSARSRTLFHPVQANQCHSPRHKTLIPQRAPPPSKPSTAAAAPLQQQRPQPPPLPQRNNEESTMLLSSQMNKPAYANTATLPAENAPLNRGVGGGGPNDDDDDSVKYYVLEGPTPTLNSDNESNA